MRNALGLMLASVVTAVVITGVWFWTSSPRADAAPPQTVAARKAEPLPAPAAQNPRPGTTSRSRLRFRSRPLPPRPFPQPQPARSTCANPDALGVSRMVVIDTTGGPGFGFLQYKQFDFLTDKEVVLTFDDGPWPTTPAVLKALADECTKGLFFPVGKHTTYHPEILKQVFAAGHTVGSHTWSHAHLDGKKMTEPQMKEEIEKGFSAVKMAIGTAPAPFFRFPGLGHTQAALGYLASRNISMFSVDVDSNDFKSSGPDQVINNVMTKLDKQGKGVILMHDLQKHTGDRLADAAAPPEGRRLQGGADEGQGAARNPARV